MLRDLDLKSQDLTDEDVLSKRLTEIDQIVPSMLQSTRNFTADIVVGKGTCGLGAYHERVRRVVRQSQLRDWIVDAEQRLLQKQSRDLNALAEAHKNAMLMERMKKEEDMYQEQEHRRRQKAADRKKHEELMEVQRQEKLQWKAELNELQQRNVEIAKRERDKQLALKKQQDAIDELNRQMRLEQQAEEEREAQLHRSEIREAVMQCRSQVKEVLHELKTKRHDNAHRIIEADKTFLEKRAARYDSDAREKRKAAKEFRTDHMYAMQASLGFLEEEHDKSRAWARSVLNAEPIKVKQDSQLAAVRKKVVAARERDVIVRSVSSLL